MSSEVAARPARPAVDRFLVGIVAGVAALLLIALLCVFVLRQPAGLRPADTAGAVVQTFYAAVQEGNYAQAYGLLSDSLDRKPTQEQFAQYNEQRIKQPNVQRSARITFEGGDANSTNVTLAIDERYGSDGLFNSNLNTNQEFFTLRREANGWRITMLPPTYYEPPPGN